MSLLKSPDNKKRFLTYAQISTLLISALAGSLLVDLVVANPSSGAMKPLRVYHESVVISPQNKTYNTRKTNLTFTISTNDPAAADWCEYYCVLDGQTTIISPVKVINDHTTPASPSIAPKRTGPLELEFHTTIENLKDGSHTLFCNKKYLFDMAFEGYLLTPKVYFSVDATAPALRINTPDGKVFSSTCLQLEFSANEAVSWLGYSLDGEEVCFLYNLFEECPRAAYDSHLPFSYRIRENTILAGLLEGSHNLILYANDSFGNSGQSEVFNFTIVREKVLNTISFGSFFVIGTAIISAVAITSFGFVAYFARHNRKRAKT